MVSKKQQEIADYPFKFSFRTKVSALTGRTKSISMLEFCLNPCRRTLKLDKLACFGFSLRCSWMQQTTASFLWCRLSHVLTAFRFGCYTYFSIWDATQKHLETLFSSVSSLSLSVLSLGLSAALSSSRSLCHCR